MCWVRKLSHTTQALNLVRAYLGNDPFCGVKPSTSVHMSYLAGAVFQELESITQVSQSKEIRNFCCQRREATESRRNETTQKRRFDYMQNTMKRIARQSKVSVSFQFCRRHPLFHFILLLCCREGSPCVGPALLADVLKSRGLVGQQTCAQHVAGGVRQHHEESHLRRVGPRRRAL